VKKNERLEPLLFALSLVLGIPICTDLVLPPMWALIVAAELFTGSLLFRNSRTEVRLDTVAALLLSLCFVPLSIIVSVDIAVSFRQAAVLVWCISIYFLTEGIFAVIPDEQRLRSAHFWLTWIGFITAIGAIAGMERIGKLPVIEHLYAWLPRLHMPGGESGAFPANETGAVVSWLIPALLPFVIAVKSKSGVGLFRRTLPWIAILLLTAALALSQSRGALLAVCIGSAAALALSGRRGRIILGVLLAGAAAAVFLVGIDRIEGLVSYHRRFDSFLPLLSGRSDIWIRAWMLFLDVPTTGFGLGAFGTIVHHIYPFERTALANPLEDAHNLFLQTGLDLGVAGALVFFALLIILGYGVLQHLRSQSGNPEDRAVMAGIAGALTAYLAGNTFDAVSLGSPAHIIGWILFGLCTASRARTGNAARRRTGIAALVTLIVASLVVSVLLRPAAEQATIIQSARYLITGKASLYTGELSRFRSGGSAASLWYTGLAAHQAKDTVSQSPAWLTLASRDARYIPFIEHFHPRNIGFALAVLDAAPGNSDALFWAGRALRDSLSDSAIACFRRGLRIDPANGLAWLQYGDLMLANHRPGDALRAYSNACFHDDPGLNGCWKAGRTAELLGDTVAALRYYRISEYSEARKRAAQLSGQ